MNKPQNMFYRALRQNVQWLCVWVGHKLSLSLWQRTFAQNVRWKSFLSGYFFQKISQHLNPKNEFLFQRPKKNVSDYDEVWYQRRHCLSANVALDRKLRTSQKNETGQLSRPIHLYRHPNTAHYGTLLHHNSNGITPVHLLYIYFSKLDDA